MCLVAFFYLRFESFAIHQDQIGFTSNRLSGLFDKFGIRAFMGLEKFKQGFENVGECIYLSRLPLVMLNFYSIVS